MKGRKAKPRKGRALGAGRGPDRRKGDRRHLRKEKRDQFTDRRKHQRRVGR
jgi:hypothetical protein